MIDMLFIKNDETNEMVLKLADGKYKYEYLTEGYKKIVRLKFGESAIKHVFEIKNGIPTKF